MCADIQELYQPAQLLSLEVILEEKMFPQIFFPSSTLSWWRSLNTWTYSSNLNKTSTYLEIYNKVCKHFTFLKTSTQTDLILHCSCIKNVFLQHLYSYGLFYYGDCHKKYFDSPTTLMPSFNTDMCIKQQVRTWIKHLLNSVDQICSVWWGQ